MSFMKGDLLTRTRKLVKGLAKTEPVWLKAMEKAPPATFPRAENKINRIVYPTDAYVIDFYQKHPDSLYQDPKESQKPFELKCTRKLSLSRTKTVVKRTGKGKDVQYYVPQYCLLADNEDKEKERTKKKAKCHGSRKTKSNGLYLKGNKRSFKWHLFTYDQVPSDIFSRRVFELKGHGVDEDEAKAVAHMEYRNEKKARKKAYKRLKEICRLQGKKPPPNPYPSAIKEIQAEEKKYVRDRFFNPDIRRIVEKLKEEKSANVPFRARRDGP